MTIKDVAKYCGVSVSTVSRVLNDRSDVSERVRSAVMDAVRQLNYVPNNSARDLVMPAADAVGIVIRGHKNQFYGDIVSALERKFKAAGYTVFTENIRHGEDELWAGARFVKSKKLRGVVFLGGQFDYKTSDIEKIGVPFVLCTYTNSFGRLSPESYSSVTVDDAKLGYDVTMRLIESGHKRIAIVLSTVDDRSVSELRYMGYRKALYDSGLIFDPSLLIEAGEYSMGAAKAAMKKALEKGAEFSAVFAISDSIAIAVMKALSELGKKVPDDCSIVGVDGIEMAGYTVPELCTMAQPVRALGEHSARVLIEMMSGGESEHIILESEFVCGGSFKKI